MMIFRMFNFMGSRMDEFIEEKRDIKQILDEQFLLQDLVMPQQQYKLLNYIKDHPEHLEQLIEYIVDINDEQSFSRQQYKYPFLSSEILSKENDFFQEYLFEEQNLHFLNRLFTLLNEDSINTTQAGYFSKIILTLLRKKYSKMIEYLNNKDISNLLKHIDISHIAEILERILIPISEEINDLNKQKELLQRIMKISLHRYYEIEVFDNCMQILINLIKSPINQWQIELVEVLLNPYFFLTICYQSQRTSAYELVSSLLYFINNSGKSDYYLNFIEVAKQISNAFNTYNPFSIQYETTYGDVITALSQNKLILLQIYYQLLQSEKEEILDELVKNNSFQTITQLILQHQQNNQALIWYEKIITCLSQKLSQIFEQQYIKYLQQIMMEYNKNEKLNIGKLKNKVSPSIQGIFTKISNLLNLLYQNNNDEQWNQYSMDTLTNINQIEQKYLCDVDPKPKQNLQQTTEFSDDAAYNFINENDKQGENDYADEYEEEDDKENQENQQENQEQIQNNQDNQEEKFYDCNEEGQKQQQAEQNQNLHRKLSVEEKEQIEEQIEEIIQDPSTRIEEVAQLIETEQKLDFEMDPVHLEEQQDNQVNTFFKTHEEQE